jgi:hypothetical protein
MDGGWVDGAGRWDEHEGYAKLCLEFLHSMHTLSPIFQAKEFLKINTFFRYLRRETTLLVMKIVKV